jgi:mitochondrial cardiolipin hydrolase
MESRTAVPTALVIILLALGAGAGFHASSSFLERRGAAGAGQTTIDGPYFSDGDQPAEHVIAAINRAHSTLDVAMFDLTQPDITAALDHARRRGVKIRLVADVGQAGDQRSEVPYLRSRGVPVRLSGGYRGERSIMHNKFAVFDRQTVETGSFNWTSSADRYNLENMIFISSPAVVDRYESEFERIWAQAR